MIGSSRLQPPRTPINIGIYGCTESPPLGLENVVVADLWTLKRRSTLALEKSAVSQSVDELKPL